MVPAVFIEQFLRYSSIHYYHHAATQDPGHGTKFVTLPSSYLYKSIMVGQTVNVLCDQI